MDKPTNYKDDRPIEDIMLDEFIEKLILKYGLSQSEFDSELMIAMSTPHCHTDKIKYGFAVPEGHALAFKTRCEAFHTAIMEEFYAGVKKIEEGNAVVVYDLNGKEIDLLTYQAAKTTALRMQRTAVDHMLEKPTLNLTESVVVEAAGAEVGPTDQAITR